MSSVRSDKIEAQEIGPRRTIIRRIVFLFILLIAMIIGNAIYSTLQETKKVKHQLAQELRSELIIAESILNNEIDKLEMVSGIIKEQNSKFVDFLDYDKVKPITVMLQTIAVKHDIDLIFLFDGEDNLLTCNRLGAEFSLAGQYQIFLKSHNQQVGLTEIPPSILALQNLPKSLFPKRGKVLALQSLVHLLHDSGDIYGFIVMAKIINGDKKLAGQMKKISGAEIIFFNNDLQTALTSFEETHIAFPHENILHHNGLTYATNTLRIQNNAGKDIGHLTVALNQESFLQQRRRLITTNLIPFFGSVVISIALFLLLKFRVFNKINQLIIALHQVTEKEGNLSIRLEEPDKKETGIDEVENMAIDFNVMMNTLEETYNQLSRARKEAEVASVSKSEFLANMSHELRTPLNAIIGFTEIVLDKHFGELNPVQEDYLNDVLQSSRHLLSVINDILDLSKVEAGKLELNMWEFHLGGVLANSFIMIKEKAQKNNITLSLDTDKNLPGIVMADERKVKQILFNLLANAIKFTPPGGHISVKAINADISDWLQHSPADSGQQTLPRGKLVKISVSDTGIGLNKDDMERIFTPFEQVEESSSRKYQGTGLGLSLTKRLVELHHGRIWAESQGPGKGSTFTFILPV
ncbi:MAG: hypothetical protein KQH63_00280 [Desulfobulbaceae bacterium]|nr:hypothetical protein [Desulfobulbaceae bacterium]